MCGIVGYTGHRPAVPLLVEGLRRLEYRGYDSAGVAFVQNRKLEIIRAPGKLSELEAKLGECNVYQATSGMGHTRWATHGLPTEKNAHPHRDNANRLALVHNGIIENFQELKDELKTKGHEFITDTDTEVLVHLIAEGLKSMGLTEALAWALRQAEGSYSVVLVDRDNPGVIHGARRASPLVLGVGAGEHFLASDIPAFLPYTREVVFLEDDEIARIDAGSWRVLGLDDLAPRDKEIHHITWDVQAAEKGGYKHFMLKEIFEQPRVIADCLAGRLHLDRLEAVIPELDAMPTPKRLNIVACGTSFHAGLWGMYLMESWARLPVRVEIASEFRYRDLVLDEDDVVMVISQSGETADTLASLRMIKERGIPVLGLCNVVGSSIAREADSVIYTQAGPEISVASTKAMCSQLAVLTLMALHWGRVKGALDPEISRQAVRELKKLPDLLEGALPMMRKEAQGLARRFSSAQSFLYLGRGPCYPLALEGALKLKEISYIHAEGYAAGEMKHGPIALVDPDFPTFALAPDDPFFPKLKSNLEEVQARDGRIIALTHPEISLHVDHVWPVPKAWGPLSAFLMLPALQLFAYEAADYLGNDVDQPRNLAKSVTVE